MPSSHLILCHPLLLLPPIPPSIRVFFNESALCMRWPKYWSFSLSISPSNEHPELVSFRMDWLDLLAVQGTLKSLLQHHSSKALILRCSALFTVQLSHLYMTTGKTIALTRRTFVGKVISLIFNISDHAERNYPTPKVRGATESARLQRRRRSQEELSDMRGQGRRPRGAIRHARSGMAAERSHPTPEVRCGGRDELPHARGQELRPRGATPRPRSGGCMGKGRRRRATPRSRSGGATSSKVRSSSCTLLEQP